MGCLDSPKREFGWVGGQIEKMRACSGVSTRWPAGGRLSFVAAAAPARQWDESTRPALVRAGFSRYLSLNGAGQLGFCFISVGVALGLGAARRLRRAQYANALGSTVHVRREVAVEYSGSMCAIANDQSIVCDGLGMPPGFTPPTGQFTRLVATLSGMCAIRTDGSLACFGERPLVPPADW